MLLAAIFGLLGRMPADGGGIKKNFRALHGREARGFRIPLVPANQNANFAVAGLPRSEAEVPGREIKLLVIERVVGNMHFSVRAEQRTVRVNDRRCVMVNTGGALLEERSNDYDFVVSRQLLKRLGARSWNRFGQ